jgi:DNA-binding transcriptional LysR family regulator
MDLRQLELFLAVIEQASVTKAAGRMSLSPSAVSLQLRNLAVGMRTELFVKSGKRLVPTPAALRLAEHARCCGMSIRSNANLETIRRRILGPFTWRAAPPH